MNRYSSKNISLLLTYTIALFSFLLPDSNLAFAGDNKPHEKQQIALKEGQVSVSGSNGQYTGQVLVKGSIRKAWTVLTDYNNFEHFFPNVVSSQLLQDNGTKKVFEQTNLIQAAIFTKKVSVRIAVTESYPQQISFQAIDGGVKYLSGSWQLKVVGDNLVLITHQVNIEPKSASERDIFFSIYKDNLYDTLEALDREIAKRY
jgi:ribosome-associated toxin RatA of RatAB toxin-antitoxin module